MEGKYLVHSTGLWKNHKYLRKIKMHNGTWRYIYGTKGELDKIELDERILSSMAVNKNNLLAQTINDQAAYRNAEQESNRARLEYEQAVENKNGQDIKVSKASNSLSNVRNTLLNATKSRKVTDNEQRIYAEKQFDYAIKNLKSRKASAKVDNAEKKLIDSSKKTISLKKNYEKSNESFVLAKNQHDKKVKEVISEEERLQKGLAYVPNFFLYVLDKK